jgi:hypothetical protein
VDDKILSQSLTHLDSRKTFSYLKHRESSEDGDVVDEAVVVEIKSFVWRQLRSQPQESYEGKASTTSYVQPSSSREYLSASSSYIHLNNGTNTSQTRTLERAEGAATPPLTWSFCRSFVHPSTTYTYCVLEHASRWSMVFQPTASLTHWTCPNSARSSPVLAIPCQKFQRGVDDTEPVQTVRVQSHRGSLLMQCQLRSSSFNRRR